MSIVVFAALFHVGIPETTMDFSLSSFQLVLHHFVSLFPSFYISFVNKKEKIHDLLKIFLEIYARTENLPYLCTRFAQNGATKKRSLNRLHKTVEVVQEASAHYMNIWCVAWVEDTNRFNSAAFGPHLYRMHP